ncbi:MAG TPA: 50S ribosomal protein L9 [Synergistaceae bacterium]|nr:50S ribosomal protein L9 [Synergistaceae bacterium]HPJ24995.1 50S ribosomal protein L9 [Synergistaceae bacterium]HPQ37219.1 50S ribosomal protein L9 [Synergistaceae bacterium]
MQVILKQDVRKLGKTGDLVEVSEGYGRNYLLPRGLAEEASGGKLKDWKNQQKVKQSKLAREEVQAEETKKHLQGRNVTISVSTGGGGKLFGSVTAAQVAEALEKQLDVKVDKRNVKLEDPIRQLGSFPFTVKLHPGVEASLTVSVEPEE